MEHNTDTTPTKVHQDAKLGVIPDGWSTPKINEVFQFINTTSFSRDQLNYDEESDLYYIHYGDIHATYKKPLLDFEIEAKVPKLNSDVMLPASIQYLKDGDVIIADASEDYAGVGEAIEIKNLNGKAAISGLHTFALRAIDNETVAGFRTYIFKNPNVKKALKTIATGSKVYGISKGNIQKFKIVLPTIPEQQEIAQILATWDVATIKQEALIKEKQQQKKSLMQQLLSGKKRFTGFDKKISFVKIKQIGKVLSGGTPSTSNSEYWNGGVPWCTPTEITGLNGLMNIIQTERTISESGLKNSSANLLPRNSLIVCTRATIGACAINTIPMATNQGFKNIIPEINKIDIIYLYYTVQTIKPKMIALSSGSTFLELSKTDFESIKIPLPSLKEQQKVAEVLMAADNEITSLQQQLQKLKTQKQGLMQQLLTGKIRVKLN